MFRHCLIVLLAFCYTNAVSDTNYRLNSLVSPVSYDITIRAYFETGDDKAFTFDGDLSLVLKTESENVTQIKLHSQDLEFSAENVTVVNGNTVISLHPENPIVFDTNYTFVYLNLESSLTVNTEYTLTISYRGPIRDDLNGFYKSYYYEQGTKKWLGATQMEPTHARKVFPCFDEPEYKATFTVTIERPVNYTQSLSNMKLETTTELADGYTRDKFFPTPIMSTYLVAFLVSEFDTTSFSYNNTADFGVYVRPEAMNQTEYALDFGKRVIEALGNYFGIDYYSTNEHLKMDHVGLPDFRAGAMENWGLVKYRESLFNYVPEHSGPYYKYRVAQIIAHETTHMWFGDLVTCHWWSNTWLNEGFANYFQDYITSLIEPDIGSYDLLVTSSLYQAYTADEVESAAPITNEDVNSPAEISGHFGTISYQKAGAVIRMMHNLLGDDAFKYGLNYYLNNSRFSVGYPQYMYDALDKGASTYDALSSYGLTVSEVMDSWVSQAGHPILEVTVNGDEVTLTQRRFYLDASKESDELYNIPITYTSGVSPDFTNTKPAFVMTGQNYTFTVANLSSVHTWILFNVQETGLYRVNYNSHAWEHISSALQDPLEEIHNLNRAKIVNDLFAFLEADVVDFATVEDMLKFLKNDTDYSVWTAAIAGLRDLRTKYYGTETGSYIDSFALDLMSNVISELGFNVRDTDDFVTLRNRQQLLEFACKIGHEDCIDFVVGLFEELRINGTEIAPSLRPVAYCNGLRYGDSEDYDFLFKRFQTTNVANEAVVIQAALGCTRVEEKLTSYLSSVLEDVSPIRSQDITAPFINTLGDHSNVQLVWQFFKDNYQTLVEKYTLSASKIESVIPYIVEALHSEEELVVFEAWLASCGVCSQGVKDAGIEAVETARNELNWTENHRDAILNVFRDGASSTTPTVLVFLLAFVGKCLFTF